MNDNKTKCEEEKTKRLKRQRVREGERERSIIKIEKGDVQKESLRTPFFNSIHRLIVH